MNKTDRLSFLRNRYAALFGVALAAGQLPVTSSEVKSEKNAIESTRAKTDSEETESAGGAVDAAWGGFDKPAIRREKESDYLLTPAERAELARIAAKPATVASETEVNETVSPVDVPEFVPVLDPAVDAELAAGILVVEDSL